MKSSASRPSFLSLALYPIALWLWMAWACAGEWLRNPNYQYGLLMLPIAVYFFAKRVSAFSFSDEKRPAPVAWCILFFIAFLVLPVELFRLSPLYWRLLPWIIGFMAAMASFAVAMVLGGRPLQRAVAFPVIFLLLAIPWPTIIEQATTLPLMNFVASLVGQTALLIGVPAQVSGSVITLPGCMIGIEEACSGLRSFQTALVISLAAGELYLLTLKRRVFLFLFAAVLAFLGNIARTFLLTWAGMKGGKLQIEQLHDPAAWGFLLLLVIGILAVATLLRPRVSTAEANIFISRFLSLSVSPRSIYLLWILGLGGFLAAQSWYILHGNSSDGSAKQVLADRGKQDSSIENVEVPKEVREILSPTKGNYFLASGSGELPLSAYHFYWAPSRSSAFQVYHRPDICMPGAGWKQSGPVTRMNIEISGNSHSWYVFPYERNHIHAFLLWSAWMDGKSMEFHFDKKMPVQRSTTLRFITNGKRVVSYEVAAILIPSDNSTLPYEQAEKAVHLFFVNNENSPGS